VNKEPQLGNYERTPGSLLFQLKSWEFESDVRLTAFGKNALNHSPRHESFEYFFPPFPEHRLSMLITIADSFGGPEEKIDQDRIGGDLKVSAPMLTDLKRVDRDAQSPEQCATLIYSFFRYWLLGT